eukprot:m51a1_g1828 hypothetical protein (441) ;mRNA; r:528860-530359
MSSNANGALVHELFCAEATVKFDGEEYIGLRWYAAHDTVVGIEHEKEAVDQAAQQTVVDYLYELLASRDELAAIGLHIDVDFWSREYFCHWWMHEDHMHSFGPNANPLVVHIHKNVVDLRTRYLSRPYGTPQVAEHTIAMRPVAEPGASGTPLAVVPATGDERRAAGQPQVVILGPHHHHGSLGWVPSATLSTSQNSSMLSDPDPDPELTAQELEASVILATLRGPQTRFGADDMLEASPFLHRPQQPQDRKHHLLGESNKVEEINASVVDDGEKRPLKRARRPQAEVQDAQHEVEPTGSLLPFLGQPQAQTPTLFRLATSLLRGMDPLTHESGDSESGSGEDDDYDDDNNKYVEDEEDDHAEDEEDGTGSSDESEEEEGDYDEDEDDESESGSKSEEEEEPECDEGEEDDAGSSDESSSGDEGDTGSSEMVRDRDHSDE